MTLYLINHSDSVGLYNHRNYLEQLPQRIEVFKLDLDLVPPHEVGSYREPALLQTTERAKRELSLWPDMVKPLRLLHQDFTLFIRETNRFVDQLTVYKQLKDRDGLRENINTIAVGVAPFNMVNKLGISASTHAPEVVALVRQKLRDFEERFSSQTSEIEQIRQSVLGVIPRFIDFMNTTIADHEAMHRTNNKQLSDAVVGQLSTAKSKIHWSEKQYLYGLQAASNMGTYCARMTVLLQDARADLSAIGDQSNIKALELNMSLMGARTHEAEDLAKRVLDML